MNRNLRLQSIHRDYLKAAYELGELKDKNGVPPREILERLDLSEEKGDRVLEFLVDAGMIVWPAKGQLLLTETGLQKAQELKYASRRMRIGPLQKTSLSLSHRQRSLSRAPRHLRAAEAG